MALPFEDAFHLTQAMSGYAGKAAIGYEVKSYGEGLMMLKATNRSQGRCLFFKSELLADGTELLTARLFYKKESMRVPARVLDSARERMKKVK